MEIGDIQVRNLDIPDIPVLLSNPSTALPPIPPVVLDIGIPVVDMPGCIEAHESNSKSNTVGQDDENGLVTYCDAGVPSFNPISYEPENLVITRPTPVPKTDTTPEPEVNPNIPKAETPPIPTIPDCPTDVQKAQEPVGTYINGYRDKVTEYKLIDNICVQITEPVPIPEQVLVGLPSGGQVAQVGGIAVIATTSALLAKPLADILLKAVKPAVKKVMKKIATIRKKPIPVKSSGERRAEQRQMNHAVKALRSVFPRKKKKG